MLDYTTLDYEDLYGQIVGVQFWIRGLRVEEHIYSYLQIGCKGSVLIMYCRKQ